MAGVRVDRLALRLQAPAAERDRAASLQAFTESQFMPAVLHAMHRRLRTRYGETAVIRIRRLAFHCTLRPGVLDTAFIETLADDLAAGVALSVTRDHGAGALPSPHAAAQVYRDAAHAAAAALIAAAERRPGPEGATQDFGTLWQSLVRGPPPAIARVLARCHAAAKLPAVLARLDLPALVALERRLAAAPAAIKAAIHAARTAAARRAAARPQSARTASADPRQPSPRAAPPAPTLPRTAAPGEDPQASAQSPPEHRTQTAESPYPAPQDAAETSPPSPDYPTKKPHETAVSPHGPHRAAIESTGAPAAPADRPQHAEPGLPDETTDPIPGTAIAADWCGLLYLVNIWQKLDVPERLWQVGADEGAMLSALLHHIGGDDPATRVLSSRFPDAAPPPAPLADWALEELTTGIADAAATLVAATRDRPSLTARTTMIAAWFAPDSRPASRFTPWATACTLAVFEAMTGKTIVPGALADHFRRPGTIEIDGDTLRIIQPMAAIDTEIRHAGLDADAGWLAWLGKSLVFVFEGSAS